MTELLSREEQSHLLYRKRLEPVLSYIQENPGQTLQLSEAAELSHFSKYHFHRIFNAVIGESLNEYTSRVRLEKAANLNIRLNFMPGFILTGCP